jgi:hypothetical protein
MSYAIAHLIIVVKCAERFCIVMKNHAEIGAHPEPLQVLQNEFPGRSMAPLFPRHALDAAARFLFNGPPPEVLIAASPEEEVDRDEPAFGSAAPPDTAGATATSPSTAAGRDRGCAGGTAGGTIRSTSRESPRCRDGVGEIFSLFCD